MFKFIRLPRADQRLLLHAALLLVFYTIRVRIFPSQTVRPFLDGAPPSRKGAGGETGRSRSCRRPVERIAWSVRTAGRWVPGATCLERALATSHLMGQNGWPVVLQIGVARRGDQGVDAHAWVEHEGMVVMGMIKGFSRFRAMRRKDQEGPSRNLSTGWAP